MPYPARDRQRIRRRSVADGAAASGSASAGLLSMRSPRPLYSLASRRSGRWRLPAQSAFPPATPGNPAGCSRTSRPGCDPGVIAPAPAVMAEQKTAIGTGAVLGACRGILLQFHRHVDNVPPVQQGRVTGEEIVQADADGDAGILARQVQHGPHHHAGMRIWPVRAREDDQFRGGQVRQVAPFFATISSRRRPSDNGRSTRAANTRR